jgi:hypothetical protein
MSLISYNNNMYIPFFNTTKINSRYLQKFLTLIGKYTQNKNEHVESQCYLPNNNR